jgi:hypothetical protein
MIVHDPHDSVALTTELYIAKLLPEFDDVLNKIHQILEELQKVERDHATDAHEITRLVAPNALATIQPIDLPVNIP